MTPIAHRYVRLLARASDATSSELNGPGPEDDERGMGLGAPGAERTGKDREMNQDFRARMTKEEADLDREYAGATFAGRVGHPWEFVALLADQGRYGDAATYMALVKRVS